MSFGTAFFELWRRLWLLPVLLLILAVGFSLFMADAGRFVSSPVDEPAPADLIVALGGEAIHRADKAAELFKAGYAERIFLAGPVDGRGAYLQAHGLPAEAILSDGKSRHSWDEAINSYALMRSQGWKTVLVVSDPPHMRRLAWTWGRVFAGSGMTFRLIPAPLPGWDAAHWWRVPGSKAYVESELEKLVYYIFRYMGAGPEFDWAEMSGR